MTCQHDQRLAYVIILITSCPLWSFALSALKTDADNQQCDHAHQSLQGFRGSRFSRFTAFHGNSQLKDGILRKYKYRRKLCAAIKAGMKVKKEAEMGYVYSKHSKKKKNLTSEMILKKHHF